MAPRTLTANAGSTTHVHNLAGWADAKFATGTGIAVAVKGLSQQVPKVLEVDALMIAIKLWGGTPMSLQREEDRVLAAYQELGYQKEWLAFSGEPNPVGISKTHEIWFWPTQTVANNRLINDLVQRPVACCPDPVHSCATDYVWGIRPSSQSPPAFHSVEGALENMLRFVTTRDNTDADYDEWNFGDLRLFATVRSALGDNGGYNCGGPFLVAVVSYRKTVLSRRGNQQCAATSWTWTRWPFANGHRRLQQFFGESPGGPIITRRCNGAGPSLTPTLYVDHPAYLLLCWLMTGYEVARVVLQTKCQERINAGYGGPGPLTVTTWRR